jgi:DNA topoisomerase IA
MKHHAGLLQELLVATDDDLAGELIGLQVAEVAATTLGAIPVRRMRFHSLEFEHLRDAMTIAGHRFDADMLAAGLLREVMNALDQERFTSRLPQQPYVGEAERAMVALVAERDQDETQTVEVRLSDAQTGHTFVGYVPQNPAILASPSRMDTQTANALATALQGAAAAVLAQGEVARVPALYPASTTQRILAAAADELGMMPWEAQGHLNAMYQAGARPETSP